MQVVNAITIRADMQAIYELAAAVEHWPRLLPHYRWVKVLRDDGDRRVVEMAARRDAIPVWWCAEQVRRPDVPCITFRHVRGFTAGMEVEWRFARDSDGVHVSILHDYQLNWPYIGPAIAEWIVGRFFVENIAGKTLRQIKRIAESNHGGGVTPHGSLNVVHTQVSPPPGPTQRSLRALSLRSGEGVREAAPTTESAFSSDDGCKHTRTRVRFIQSPYPVPDGEGANTSSPDPFRLDGGVETVGV